MSEIIQLIDESNRQFMKLQNKENKLMEQRKKYDKLNKILDELRKTILKMMKKMMN